MLFEEAVQYWTETVNDWYALSATTDEVAAAFTATFPHRDGVDGRNYIETFFKASDGSWSQWLDTVDREALADAVERLRGKPPLPTYADVGGVLLNKCRR